MVQLLCSDSLNGHIMYCLESLDNHVEVCCALHVHATVEFPDSVDQVTVVVAISFISTEKVLHI